MNEKQPLVNGIFEHIKRNGGKLNTTVPSSPRRRGSILSLTSRPSGNVDARLHGHDELKRSKFFIPFLNKIEQAEISQHIDNEG